MLIFNFDLRSSLLTMISSTSNATRPLECEHSWLSLLTRFGIADASIAGLRREWGLTPLCEAAATFSGYSEGLSRLSLNRSLQFSTFNSQ